MGLCTVDHSEFVQFRLLFLFLVLKLKVVHDKKRLKEYHPHKCVAESQKSKQKVHFVGLTNKRSTFLV